MNFDSHAVLAQDISMDRFARRFLTRHGALIEKNTHGFDALLPENLRELFGAPDLVSFGTDPNAETDGPGTDGTFADDSVTDDSVADGSVTDDSVTDGSVHEIDYGSTFLERMITQATRRIPLVGIRFQPDYLKKAGFHQLINRQFRFPGTKGTIESKAVVKTRYLLVVLWYLAQSDEQKEGLFSVMLHEPTGAYVPEMPATMADMPYLFRENRTAFSMGKDRMERLFGNLEKRIPSLLSSKIERFHDSMNRRLKRDTRNLYEYYQALKNEMEMSLERKGLSERLIEDRREKIALIPEELAQKQQDLKNKYGIRIKIEPRAAVQIDTEAVQVLYRLNIGREVARISLFYNPVTKAMDPVVCEGCGRSIETIHFSKTLRMFCRECTVSRSSRNSYS